MDSKFNRNYRVMWSEPLGQWVVASELASPGGKGKSRGAASRILCAALVAGGMMAAAPEDAAALTGTGGAATVCTGTAAIIGAPLTGQCVAKATDSLTLSNTGSISGSSLPGTVVVDPYSTGVTIDNSGTIASAGAGAGIDIYSNAASTPTGTTITNRAGATISAVTTNNKFAHGILFAGTGTPAGLDGALTNVGTIGASASRSSGSSVTAYGILNNGALSGTLDNSGTISAAASLPTFTATAPNVSAYGVVANSGVSGTLLNSGTISAAATDAAVGNVGSNSVVAFGVRNLGGGLSGTMTNSGTISATGTENGTNTTSSMKVKAYGVGGGIQTGGVLTNSGSISATAVNNGTAAAKNVSALAYGVNGNLVGTGKLTNTSTGTISATAVNHGAGIRETVTAYGVYSYTLSGTLTNDGSISASASNDGTATSSVLAYGGYVFTLGGTISNTGSISAGGIGTATATFYGLYIWNMSGGTVNNSGTISASPNAGMRSTAYSLYQANAGGGSGTINNQASGMLSGNLFVADPYATVNNAGTIALPANATVNTIAGDYNQTAGGVLAVDVYSTASYGKLGVGKTADVSASGNIRVHVPAVNALAVGDVLPGVLTAATFVPATTYTVTDDSTAFDFTAATNAAGTGVDLTVVAQAPAPAAAPVADSGGCLIQPDAGLDTVLPMTLMGALMLLLGRIFGVRKEDN